MCHGSNSLVVLVWVDAGNPQFIFIILVGFVPQTRYSVIKGQPQKLPLPPSNRLLQLRQIAGFSRVEIS
jgi:hypothetical protein